jgi:hypothetical protein
VQLFAIVSLYIYQNYTLERKDGKKSFQKCQIYETAAAGALSQRTSRTVQLESCVMEPEPRRKAVTEPQVHCPKTHEQFPSRFGNAEVISSDRRKLFINIFS